MNLKSDTLPLISITVRSLKDHPFPMAIFPRPQQAVLVGKSTQKDHSFQFTTGPLNPEQTRRCRLLQRHGSTVIEFTDENRFFGWNQEKWQESIIIRAMEKMASLYPEDGDARDLAVYDPEFAHRVLEIAGGNFPRQLGMVELKSALTPEPSNEALFTAIDALEADGYIEAKAMRGHPNNQIHDVAYIRATRLGRAQLADQPVSSEATTGTTIHTQVNNYGPVGAIGANAHGAVNIHNHSTEPEHVDLRVLALQLEQLRTAFRSVAVTREDDRQIALIGDAAEAAEKGDRKGVHSVITRFSKPVLEKVQEIGTDIVAKAVAEMMKP